MARSAIIPTRIVSWAATVTRRIFRSRALSHPNTSRIAHLLPVLPVASDAEQRSAAHEEHHRGAEHAAEVAEEIHVPHYRPKEEVQHAGTEGSSAVFPQPDLHQPEC